MTRRRSAVRPGSGRDRARFAFFAAALVLFGVASQAAASVDPAPDSAVFRGVFAVGDVRHAPSSVWSGLFAPDAGRPARPPSLLADAQAVVVNPAKQPTPFTTPTRSSGQPSITWGPLLWQSLEFLVIQHTWRVTFEKNTWEDTVEGSFWDDYFTSAGNLCCWDDGDKFTTNYLFHPAMGSIAAFIFAHNHHASKVAPPAGTGAYWGAKGKQGIFAFAYSAYFELGLVLSEAAIGNVGLDGHGMTWEDLVVTPSVGMMISAGEDYLRSTLVDRIDRWNHRWGVVAALCLNPTRSVSNVIAFQKPWADPPWLTLRREERAREAARSLSRPPSATTQVR